MAEHEVIRWRCRTRLHKYADQGAYDRGDPYEVLDIDGNMLVYGGSSALWHRLIGGSTVTAFNAGAAHIGVGDSTTAAAAGQTDLQAATNKARKAMDAGYPSHTEGTTSGSETVTFKATFGATDANFAWQEWGVFNASTAGRMLNRKVSSLGTKANPAVWALTVTISLA
jgi:hypothetical protein